MADFLARHYNESENDIVWNQRWILAFAVEVRKKGENPDPSLSKRIFIKGTRELWKKTRQKNVRQKNVRQKNKDLPDPGLYFSVLRNMKGRPADSNLELATLKIINSKEASNE